MGTDWSIPWLKHEVARLERSKLYTASDTAKDRNGDQIFDNGVSKLKFSTK